MASPIVIKLRSTAFLNQKIGIVFFKFFAASEIAFNRFDTGKNILQKLFFCIIHKSEPWYY